MSKGLPASGRCFRPNGIVTFIAVFMLIKPGLLILYHQLFWGSTDEQLLDGIRRTYKGETIRYVAAGLFIIMGVLMALKII